MGRYGIQPNGMVRLASGEMWDPNTPLPSENVDAFNSTPMGSPLAGVGAMAPRAGTPPMLPPLVVPISEAPVSPGPPGMFGNSGALTAPVTSLVGDGPVGLGAALAPPPPIAAQKPSFFGQGGTGRAIAGSIGDALLGLNHQAPIYAPAMQEMQRAQREEAQWQQRHAIGRSEAVEDRNYEANKPRYFSGGQDQFVLDPATGQTKTVYDAPIPAESYARGLGYQPGTDEYRRAMQDYTLKGWGSTALDARSDLEATRYGYRSQLKGQPSYGNLHPRPVAPRVDQSGAPRSTNAVIAPILRKVAAGLPLTPGEQQALDYNRRGGGGRQPAGGAAPAGAPTATDPKTGRKMHFTNGKWVPVG